MTWGWRDPIEAHPGRIHFGTLRSLTTDPFRVLIRSTENRAFRILSVAEDEAGSVTPDSRAPIGPDAPPSTIHSLSLKLQLTSPDARAAAGTMTVMTDDSACPSLLIQWSAFVDRGGATDSRVDR